MNTLREKLVKFLKSEDGPTAVEYAVMVALISNVVNPYTLINFLIGKFKKLKRKRQHSN